jgi:MinD superfamily P-loop ATPase
MLHHIGLMPHDVDFPVSGHIVQASYNQKRQAKYVILAMMILMDTYPGVGSNALNVLMNSRTQYISPVMMN